MKKISVILLCAIMLLHLVSCSEADINLTRNDNIFDELEAYISDPALCAGKTVALSAKCTVVYNYSKNEVARYTVSVDDDDSEMRALYEIRKEDKSYPTIGSVATVLGRFTDGYIEVTEFRNASYDDRSFDVEALDMSADELEEFIGRFREECNTSEHLGKTVRIYGNCAKRENYLYLTGLDENGKYTWYVDLFCEDSTIAIPSAESSYYSTVEIIGTLDYYIENNIAYSCIKIQEIQEVEGILKLEDK